MLLKVGELARHSGLTVRTLHHFDEIGLPRPSARSEAGYRLYSRDDVARLHGIQALRHLGLPLKEIGAMLAGLAIAWLGDGSSAGSGSVHGAHGLALAFGLDALSFVLSALTLARVGTRPSPARAQGPIFAAVAEGLRAFWRDRALRTCLFTWIQCRVAPALMGRAMSVFMFIYMGLAPLSSAITGWALRSIALPTLFTAAGTTLVALVLLALAGSSMRTVTDGPAGATA